MIAQEFGYLARVRHVAFHAERERLNPLQEQKAVKWRKRGASVALAYSPATCDKSGVTKVIDIDAAVVSHFRRVQHVELFRILSPGKLAAIHNHPADTGAA